MIDSNKEFYICGMLLEQAGTYGWTPSTGLDNRTRDISRSPQPEIILGSTICEIIKTGGNKLVSGGKSNLPSRQQTAKIS